MNRRGHWGADVPAIDEEFHALNAGGIAGGQEQCGLGDILNLTQVAEGNLPGKLLESWVGGTPRRGRSAAAPHRSRSGYLIGHVHPADTYRQALGQGHLGAVGALSALAEIGFQGYLAFEVFRLPDARTAIRDGINEVRAAAIGLSL